MNKEILQWLKKIEKLDGTPPESVIAFNLGIIEGDQGFVMYFVGAFEYSEDNDDWACLEPPTKTYRYLKLPEKFQNLSGEIILELCRKALTEMEQDGTLNTTLMRNAKAITTGFDNGELIKIR